MNLSRMHTFNIEYLGLDFSKEARKKLVRLLETKLISDLFYFKLLQQSWSTNLL